MRILCSGPVIALEGWLLDPDCRGGATSYLSPIDNGWVQTSSFELHQAEHRREEGEGCAIEAAYPVV